MRGLALLLLLLVGVVLGDGHRHHEHNDTHFTPWPRLHHREHSATPWPRLHPREHHNDSVTPWPRLHYGDRITSWDHNLYLHRRYSWPFKPYATSSSQEDTTPVESTTPAVVFVPTSTLPPETPPPPTPSETPPPSPTPSESPSPPSETPTTPTPTPAPEVTSTEAPPAELRETTTRGWVRPGDRRKVRPEVPRDPLWCPADNDTRYLGPSRLPLIWPATKIGESAMPVNEACLDEQQRPVRRPCVQDRALEAVWAEPLAECDLGTSSTATAAILNVTETVVTTSNVGRVTSQLASALQRGKPCAGDVRLVAGALQRVSAAAHALSAESMPHLASLLDGVMEASAPTEDQHNTTEQDLQATASILKSMDKILSQLQLGDAPGGVASSHSSRAALLVADVVQSGVAGVAALQGAGEDTFSGVRELRPGGAALGDEDQVEVSARLLEMPSRGRAAFVIIGSPRAFNSKQEKVRLNSRVVGVTLSDTGGDNHRAHVEIELRPLNAEPPAGMSRQCAFWDLERSLWSTEGCRLVRRAEEGGGGRDVCRCEHLTHFAEILGVGGASAVLDIVSLVGCVLSLVGLLGIALTAACFKQWRQRLGNKILLHLSGAIGLTMIAFLATALGGSKGGTGDAGCIFLGALLHYSVLAAFCWMLVSAALQMLRFVVVISARPPHFLLRGAFFGWGAPLVPVVFLLASGAADHYSAEERNDGSGSFCYPHGLALILAVVVPVATAVISNLIVFCIIVYRVSCGRAKKLHGNISSVSEKRMAMRQLRMSILLFFLLGLTWIFGLLALVGSGSDGWRIACSYIFCITATLQGLVLFLFFVVWERKARALWLTTMPESVRSAITSEAAAGTSSTAGPSTATSTNGSSVRQPSKKKQVEEEAPLRQRTTEPNVNTPIREGGKDCKTYL